MNRVILILLALAIGLPLNADANVSDLERARLHLRSGRADAAVEILEGIVARKPENASAHYWLANAYGAAARGAGMFKMISMARKAGAEFGKAVENDPDHLDARFGLMEFHLMAPGILGGNEDTAVEQALEIAKRDPMAGHRAQAALAIAADDLVRARSEHLAAISENPDSAEARYWYGVFLMTSTKEYESSHDQFEAVLQLDSNYVAAHFQVGHLAAVSGIGLERGIEALTTYIGQKPDEDKPPLHRAHYWLGLIYEKEGKHSDARRHLKLAATMFPGDKDTRQALARIH